MLRKKYSKEFKLDAVSLVLEQGYSKAEAGKSLGINDNIISRWVQEYESDHGQAFRGKGKRTAEQEELHRLREENKRLKMEKEILKKAMANSTDHRNTQFVKVNFLGGTMVRALSKRSFTEHQQNAIWSLWSQGKSLSDIGRQLNKHAGSIFCFLQKYGGIKPAKPIRSKRALTLSEREEISRGLSANLSIRNIAKSLNRSPSTISREIKRNGGITKYRAISADRQTWLRAKRPKESKLQINVRLNDIITEKLSNKWSPEQISGYLKRT